MSVFRVVVFLILVSLILTSCGKSGKVEIHDPIRLELQNVNNLAQLPLSCIYREYPNKLNQILTGPDDLGEPSEIHPVFYGCFDWHSAVHAHWSLLRILHVYPNVEYKDSIRSVLYNNLISEKLLEELAYFEKEHNKTFERTYGWAWLLKLSAELLQAEETEMYEALKPLTNYLVELYTDYITKLSHPIRTGEHDNTAFSMNLILDYARTTQDSSLIALIENRALDFYIEDEKCPMHLEPGGHDFLSPCLEEILLMSRVMERTAFDLWAREFLPDLYDMKLKLKPLNTEYRADGKLVHLEGLNFSRARCLYALGSRYSDLAHLILIANEHAQASMSVIFEPEYSGSHWLASFALLALTEYNPYVQE